MPKVTEEYAAARREEILDGARRAFSRWGYEGATVARLEEETGLSRGAIFNYFENKQDLFVELAYGESRRYVELLVEGGVENAIRTMAGENPDWIGVLIEVQARLRQNAEFQRMLESRSDGTMQTMLVDWFRDRQHDGTFRPDVEPIDLARFATMVLNGLAIRVVVGDPTEIESVLRLLHDALAPPK
jgi:AcrR family transcriptional regulator